MALKVSEETKEWRVSGKNRKCDENKEQNCVCTCASANFLHWWLIAVLLYIEIPFPASLHVLMPRFAGIVIKKERKKHRSVSMYP